MWPDYYSNFNLTYMLSYFDCAIRVEIVQECAECAYTIVYNSATAKKDVKVNSDGQNYFKKGDNMASVAIYYDNELIAYQQTGFGSECENVISQEKENFDLALSKVSDLGLLTETKTLTYRELYNQQEELNAEQRINILKK